MEAKILCVDDESNILEAYQRALRRQFRLDIASGRGTGSGNEFQKGPYAVIVSDMRMPGMDGIQC